VPLIFSLASGGVGINLNGSNITYCGSIHGYNNTNLVLSYYNGVVVSPKISLTSSTTQITDGLKMNNLGIDMNSKLINFLGDGLISTDGVNKGQMDNADNLRLKLDGTTPMVANLNMNSKLINLLGDALISTDAVNKGQMDNADNLRLKLDGTTPMAANLNMNSKLIN
jgi:hypothetical protein